MLYKKIDLKQVNVFIAVYQEKHISLAAKKIGMSQSNVTQQVKSLERNTNCILFTRTAHGVIPTHEGDLFYHRILGSFQQFQHAISEIESHYQIKKDQINIAAHYPFIIHEIPQILSKFKDIPVKIFNISKQDAEKRMLEGEVDICIYPVFERDDRFFYHHFAEYNPILIVYQYNPVSLIDKVTTQDLQNQNFITIDKDLITLSSFNDLYDEYAFNAKIHFERGNWDMLVSMVKQNLGVALVNSMMINNLSKDIVYKDMSHMFPKTTYQLYISNLLSITNPLMERVIREINKDFHAELMSQIKPV